MRETSQRERRRSTHPGLTQRESDHERKHRAVDERAAAVRRWIDEDDDDSCSRGID